jgi:hypothetical protein
MKIPALNTDVAIFVKWKTDFSVLTSMLSFGTAQAAPNQLGKTGCLFQAETNPANIEK